MGHYMLRSAAFMSSVLASCHCVLGSVAHHSAGEAANVACHVQLLLSCLFLHQMDKHDCTSCSRRCTTLATMLPPTAAVDSYADACSCMLCWPADGRQVMQEPLSAVPMAAEDP